MYSTNVTPGDVGTGTGTSSATRTSVNTPTAPYPAIVSISYSSPSATGNSEFAQPPLRPGQRADAGHIIGRQSGGLGDDPASVFPQHPQQNRGNSVNGVPSFDLWRRHEDRIRSAAQSGDRVSMTVTLRDEPRPDYSRACARPGCYMLLAPGGLSCTAGHVQP